MRDYDKSMVPIRGIGASLPCSAAGPRLWLPALSIRFGRPKATRAGTPVVDFGMIGKCHPPQKIAVAKRVFTLDEPRRKPRQKFCPRKARPTASLFLQSRSGRDRRHKHGEQSAQSNDRSR